MFPVLNGYDWSRIMRRGPQPPGSIHAVILPQHTRKIAIRILKEAIVDGRPKLLELKPFEWGQPPEGEFLPEPCMQSSAMWGMSAARYDPPHEVNSVISFIQAMVDLGAELGMVPLEEKDQAGEMAALRAHLEDMRSLALKGTDQRAEIKTKR